MILTIPLSRISEEDYLSRETIDEIANAQAKRKDLDPGLITLVEEAIKIIPGIETGQRPSVVVSPSPKGLYHVKYGKDIVSAYAYLGIKDIPARIQ